VSIELPKVLVQELIKRGLDESFIVDILSKELKLDPNDMSKAHEELALRMYNEGIENLNKGDVIQASEKLYKAVEETIKALAIRRGLPEATEALERGRWSVAFLIVPHRSWVISCLGLGMLRISFTLMVFMRTG